MGQEFYKTTPTNPVKKGFYHWSQIEKLAMGYYEDDDGYLKVTLKEGAEPSDKASGMMWMWLHVSERGTAVKHPDADNREHYEYIDEFDEFRKTEALRATRKERQLITDPLVIREVVLGDPADPRVQRIPTDLFANARFRMFFDGRVLQTDPVITARVDRSLGLVRKMVCGQLPFTGKTMITDRKEAVRKVCEERSGKLV